MELIVKRGWVGTKYLTLPPSLFLGLRCSGDSPEPFFVFSLRSQRREGVFCSVPPSGRARKRLRGEGAAIAFFRPHNERGAGLAGGGRVR